MPNPAPWHCPIDGSTLVMSERQGIEIDYCPTCRGVGSTAANSTRSSSEQRRADTSAVADPRDGQWNAPQPHAGHGYHVKPHKRRKSFLEELFD